MIGSNQSPGDSVTSPSAEPPPVATPGVAPNPAGPAAPAPPVARGPSRLRRFFEWFWLGRAMAELRAQGRVGSPRALELLRRAWRSVELAERALSPVPRLLHGAADAEARELARQGLFWALGAEAVLRHEASHAAPSDAAPLAGRSLRELFAEADRSMLLAAAGGEGGLHAVEVALRVDDFADFAELSSEEQARQARDLVTFVRAVGTLLETPRVSLDRLWTRRVLRMGLAFVVLAAALGGAVYARSQRDNARDWARGRPYRASSVYTIPGCKSPDQDCPESPFFFFHTMEEDHPWLEIDLGGKRRFSAVRIVNREDCCADRAVPLAVEVSNDRTTWHEVARRNETFNTWYAEFAPTSARYVRVTTLKKAALHLHRVAVLR
ncbi:MAG TPA: discoidin domain-containing protein [Polyangiaceae bacterium]|nr:discoidin domain-containing protein [Polyangiaceae bacterium]